MLYLHKLFLLAFIVALPPSWLFGQPNSSPSVHAFSSSKDGTIAYSSLTTHDRDKYLIKICGKDGNLKHDLKIHSAPVQALCFSNKGDLLISGGTDSKVVIWDTTNWKIKQIIETDEKIRCIVISGDDQIIALACGPRNPSVVFLRQKEGKYYQGSTRLKHLDGLHTISISSDGKLLATGFSGDPFFRVWDVKNEKIYRLFNLGKNRVSVLMFSPDNSLIAAGGIEGYLAVWDVKTGKEAKLIGHTQHIYSVAFQPNGRILASGCDANPTKQKEVKLWNTKTYQPICSFGVRCRDLVTVAFSKDGELFFDGTLSEKNAMNIFNVKELLTKKREEGGKQR